MKLFRASFLSLVLLMQCAVTAYALADRPERIAPQLKRDAVGELLRKANLEEFLKTVGVWK